MERNEVRVIGPGGRAYSIVVDDRMSDAEQDAIIARVTYQLVRESCNWSEVEREYLRLKKLEAEMMMFKAGHVLPSSFST